MRVLVTGAASGIGEATVDILLEKDHEVIALDIDGEGLEELPGRVDRYQADVYDGERIENVVGSEEFDAVVNCAGYYEQAAVEDIPLEDAESIFRANYFGPANVIRAAMPELREKEGRIVNVSSVAGRIVMPFSGHYCASKHALEAFSDALRMELHDTGVEVVLVEPGVIRTGFNERARKKVAKYMPESNYTKNYQKALTSPEYGGVEPEIPARTVVRALENRDPRKRYQSPYKAKLFVWLSKLLPSRMEEFFVRKWSDYF